VTAIYESAVTRHLGCVTAAAEAAKTDTLDSNKRKIVTHRLRCVAAAFRCVTLRAHPTNCGE